MNEKLVMNARYLRMASVIKLVFFSGVGKGFKLIDGEYFSYFRGHRIELIYNIPPPFF